MDGEREYAPKELGIRLKEVEETHLSPVWRRTVGALREEIELLTKEKKQFENRYWTEHNENFALQWAVGIQAHAVNADGSVSSKCSECIPDLIEEIARMHEAMGETEKAEFARTMLQLTTKQK